MIQNILELPNERTVEETDLLVDQLFDAWICGSHYLICDYLHPTQQVYCLGCLDMEPPSEPYAEALQAALAASAIVRGDAVALQTLIDQGLVLNKESDRFNLIPLYVAAKWGDIMEVLVADQYLLHYSNKGGPSDFLVLVAQSGNKVGLSTWIESSRGKKPRHDIEAERSKVLFVLGIWTWLNI